MKRTYPVGTFVEKNSAVVAKKRLESEWVEDEFRIEFTSGARDPWAVWCTTTQPSEG